MGGRCSWYGSCGEKSDSAFGGGRRDLEVKVGHSSLRDLELNYRYLNPCNGYTREYNC